ncbi:hypothetical protein [Pseudomonas putida]|uniref:hypothetical protein n=1 Tax=Pseudomonas putida TaxID=303 RepID=UPI00235BF6E2|nr:hypothetical protein [Pseudomonas putida]GLO44572.1 hypothetical protein PPUN109347_11340 [Pseudomonas putida]
MPVTSLRKTSARPPEVAKIKIKINGKIKIKIKSKSKSKSMRGAKQNSAVSPRYFG